MRPRGAAGLAISLSLWSAADAAAGGVGVLPSPRLEVRWADASNGVWSRAANWSPQVTPDNGATAFDAFIDAGIEDPDRPARREAKPQARPQVELDAIAALIALGQIASEAEAMVDRALDRAEGAILTTDDLVAAAFGSA